MKKTFFLALCLLALCRTSTAQVVEIDTLPKYPTYIVGEPLIMKVRLANRGIAPLVIDDHPAYAGNKAFFKLSRNVDSIAPIADISIIPELDLNQNEVIAAETDLAKFFPLLEPAKYTVSLVLICNGRRYESPKKILNIVPGMELARVSQVIAANPPLERTFRLVYWQRNERDELFLRAEDSPGKTVWETLSLGPLLRVAPVKAQLDGTSLTVLHQATRDALINSSIITDADTVTLKEQKQRLTNAANPMVERLDEALKKAVDKK